MNLYSTNFRYDALDLVNAYQEIAGRLLYPVPDTFLCRVGL